MPYANNKGADQPTHPRSLISALVVRCLDSMIPVLAKSKITRVGNANIWPQTFRNLTLFIVLMMNSQLNNSKQMYVK